MLKIALIYYRTLVFYIGNRHKSGLLISSIGIFCTELLRITPIWGGWNLSVFVLEVQATKSAVIIEIEKVLNQKGLSIDIFNSKVSYNRAAYAIKIY